MEKKKQILYDSENVTFELFVSFHSISIFNNNFLKFDINLFISTENLYVNIK